MQSRTDWRALARIAVSSPPDRACKAASITKKAVRSRPFCVPRFVLVGACGEFRTPDPLDDQMIVTNRVAGNFPGSPIELQFIFRLDGKITSLEMPL
jgi:hypothetical protein